MALVPSITLKVLGIGALALLMLIPLAQVQDLIRERAAQRDQAVAAIAEGWGRPQRLGGPVLVVPREVEVTEKNGWVMTPDRRGAAPAETVSVEERTEFQLAESLETKADLAVERRRYGIYEAPVYTAQVRIAARFGPAQLAHLLGEKSGYRRDAAVLRLPVSDLRGLREVGAVRINGEARALEPSAGVAELAAVEVKLLPADLEHELVAEFVLRLAGTERLEFLPLARVSSVEASGPWGDPSFVGAPLPAQREVRDGRFSAHWQALDLNRGYRQQWVEGEGPAPTLGSAAFGLTLYEPASVYQQNTRAGKYGLLFVALTFVAFFLFEVLKKLRVHPLQYLLVGLALSTFYLVLLALSEQVGFAAAYAAAAGAVVLMVAGYAAAVLATWRAGVVLGTVLAAVYALLYFLVASEAYSLLTGALALLGVVGLLMFLTRRVDWYAYARPSHG